MLAGKEEIMFNRKKDKLQQENHVIQEENEVEVIDEIESIDNLYATKDPNYRFKVLHYHLASSEKGGFFKTNSQYYNAVLNKLEVVQDTLGKETFSGGVKKDMESIRNIVGVYGHLVTACNQYRSRKTKTARGRNRQDIVAHISVFAQKDIQGFMDYGDKLSSLPQEQRAKMYKKC